MVLIDKRSEEQLYEAACPACGNYVAVPFLCETWQPLATLAWPESARAAREMPSYPNTFVRCVDCGHIFNASFDYATVPYSTKSYRMFNRGAQWSSFLLGIQASMREYLPAEPVVVEIGHGDGSFLAGLADVYPYGRFVGFDPHGASSGHPCVEYRSELFDPIVHLPELLPDLIISRHVLEHLTSPLAFLQRIAFTSAKLGLRTLSYFEVPCVDRALATKRTTDFYYEHNSHFTTSSFTRMLERCAANVLEVRHGHEGEVVYAFLELCGTPRQRGIAREAECYYNDTCDSLSTIQRQLTTLLASGRRIAIWGGTGKSAAFLMRYHLDSERFPLVVDSDRDKVGTFVPGLGQEIRFRDWLLDHPADVIIIPAQWRARDIISEAYREGITFSTILIEHQGQLVDFFSGDHPY